MLLFQSFEFLLFIKVNWLLNSVVNLKVFSKVIDLIPSYLYSNLAITCNDYLAIATFLTYRFPTWMFSIVTKWKSRRKNRRLLIKSLKLELNF